MRILLPALSLLLLLSGCASHGTWSTSDLGAWKNLDERIGSHEQSFYIKEWGEPVSRLEVKRYGDRGKEIAPGEELLWLWEAGGTGPSGQPGQGWEVFLSFNQRGKFENWRVGTYRTVLTVSDVISVTRKARYALGSMTEHLGLSAQQHGISGGARQLELRKLGNIVFEISSATFAADVTMSARYKRLATRAEIEELIELRIAEARARAEEQQRLAYYGLIMPRGLSGGGFLGPFTPNAYGPGMNADATGKPFIWQPDPGFGPPDPFSRVQPNGYGLGVGMDQYGRPVRPACPPGMLC